MLIRWVIATSLWLTASGIVLIQKGLTDQVESVSMKLPASER